MINFNEFDIEETSFVNDHAWYINYFCRGDNYDLYIMFADSIEKRFIYYLDYNKIYSDYYVEDSYIDDIKPNGFSIYYAHDCDYYYLISTGLEKPTKEQVVKAYNALYDKLDGEMPSLTHIIY